MRLKHATKKRLAKSTTRRRTLHSGISAEHIEYRDKLNNVSTSIKSLIREIRSARQVWLDLARHQNGFAEALVKSLPSDGAVRSHAREVEATVQQLQRMILDDDSPAAPHRRIVGVLDAYLKVVQMVEKNYPDLETAYSEVLRYQRKVDKLSRKKKEDALHRNMTKLQDARAVYDGLLKEVIAKQREAFDKHEAVFQCAHHAFWIAHDKYAHVVNEATNNIRQESVAVREHLVNIDVSNTPKLTAIPRVKLLPPPQPEITAVPILEVPSETSSGKIVTPVPGNGGSFPTQVVQTVPSVPTQVLHSVSTGYPSHVHPVHPQMTPVPTQEYSSQGVHPQMTHIPSHEYSSQSMHYQTGAMEPTKPVMMPSAPPVDPYIQRQHGYEIPGQVYTTMPSTQAVHTHTPPTNYYSHETPVVHTIPQQPAVSPSFQPNAIAPTLPTEIPPPPPPIHQTPAKVPA